MINICHSHDQGPVAMGTHNGHLSTQKEVNLNVNVTELYAVYWVKLCTQGRVSHLSIQNHNGSIENVVLYISKRRRKMQYLIPMS